MFFLSQIINAFNFCLAEKHKYIHLSQSVSSEHKGKKKKKTQISKYKFTHFFYATKYIQSVDHGVTLIPRPLIPFAKQNQTYTNNFQKKERKRSIDT